MGWFTFIKKTGFCGTSPSLFVRIQVVSLYSLLPCDVFKPSFLSFRRANLDPQKKKKIFANLNLFFQRNFGGSILEFCFQVYFYKVFEVCIAFSLKDSNFEKIL